MAVNLGVWVSTAKARRDKLTADQREAPRKPGRGWAAWTRGRRQDLREAGQCHAQQGDAT